jgi:hypothetical protein
MADPYVSLGLQALPYAYDNYDKIYKPIKRKVNKLRGRGEQAEYDDITMHGGWKPDDRGLVLKKRSEVASDEEIVEVVPRRRPNNDRQLVRRTSSEDRIGFDRRDGRNDRRVVAYRDRDASDSEGSVPPRSRVSAKSRGRAKSTSGRKGKRSSSRSSSDLGSTTDDEKKCKKMERKKWITGGLAAVATIHAASKVYSSIEAHDKRVQKVALGEMSPQEAAKKRTQAHWQDAAAIAIAALGIKGAINEWSEVQEQQQEHQELLESRQDRHKRRMERRRRKAKEEAERRRQGYDSDDDTRR